MAPSAIFERIKKLEATGLITGYHAQRKSKELGLGLAASVLARADDKAGELAVGDRLAQIPEVHTESPSRSPSTGQFDSKNRIEPRRPSL